MNGEHTALQTQAPKPLSDRDVIYLLISLMGGFGLFRI